MFMNFYQRSSLDEVRLTRAGATYEKRLIKSHNFVSNTIESVDVIIGLSKTIIATKAKSPHAVYA